jgi:hypothetical protein
MEGDFKNEKLKPPTASFEEMTEYLSHLGIDHRNLTPPNVRNKPEELRRQALLRMVKRMYITVTYKS